MSNDFSNVPMPPPPPANAPMMDPGTPRPFFQTWIDALTKPNERTYTEIAGAPNASSVQAFVWVFIAALVQSIITYFVRDTVQRQFFRQFSSGQNLQVPGLGSGIIGLICGAPIGAVIIVVFFAVFVGVTYLIARAFNGRATFDQLAYVLAAITVPVSLIFAVLSLLAAIPVVGLCFGLLAFLLWLYEIALEVIAVKSVSHIDMLGAIVSVLALPVVACLCLACIIVVGFASFAPAIGNIFSSIQTPTP